MIKLSFELSKGDFLEPFLQFILRVIFKAGGKHSHESNQLDFWDIFFIAVLLLIVGGFLYQAFKKIKKP